MNTPSSHPGGNSDSHGDHSSAVANTNLGPEKPNHELAPPELLVELDAWFDERLAELEDRMNRFVTRRSLARHLGR